MKTDEILSEFYSSRYYNGPLITINPLDIFNVELTIQHFADGS
jgi:hypothetical protein